LPVAFVPVACFSSHSPLFLVTRYSSLSTFLLPAPRLHGPATDAALAAYEAEGLVPRTSLGEPGDDIATELEFLAWLCSREEQQWIEVSTEEALRLRRSSDRFLREHCANWWPAFAEAVLAQARIPIYRGFAQLLAAHLAIELGYPHSVSWTFSTPSI